MLFLALLIFGRLREAVLVLRRIFLSIDWFNSPYNRWFSHCSSTNNSSIEVSDLLLATSPHFLYHLVHLWFLKMSSDQTASSCKFLIALMEIDTNSPLLRASLKNLCLMSMCSLHNPIAKLNQVHFNTFCNVYLHGDAHVLLPLHTPCYFQQHVILTLLWVWLKLCCDWMRPSCIVSNLS